VDEALTDAGFTDDVLDNLPETEKERMIAELLLSIPCTTV
jgi:hypothetical protein